MKNKIGKMACSECDWKGIEKEMLCAPNPFELDENIYGCPSCKEINTIFIACDEPDCWERATCGTPTNEEYKITCGKHMPQKAHNK